VLVMVQAEVADRLGAGPGSRTYGVPSVKAAWYGRASRAGNISRNIFWPVPNVDSALVRLQRTADPLSATGPADASSRPGGVDREAVFTCIDAAFAQRRKTLRAALANWAGSAAEAEQILRRAGIDPATRGERLAVEDLWRSWQPGKSGRRRSSPRVRAQARQDPPRAQAHPPESPPRGPAQARQDPPRAHPRENPPRVRAHRRQDSPRVTERTGGAMVDSEIREDVAEPVHVRAPGKINLVLRVGATAPGGYHRLATVFQAVSLTEDVSATPA